MGGWCGGPWDSSVSPSPFGLDFGTLDFGTSGLGLTTTFLCKLGDDQLSYVGNKLHHSCVKLVHDKNST